MKTRHLSTYTSIAFIAAIAGGMTACASDSLYYDPDPYYSPRIMYYDFWYYPAIGAYYDPHTHIYIYYDHDHWLRARVLPPRIRPYLGHHVTVRSPHDRPYEEHHRHRQQYQPERYRERERTHHDDVWIGAPPHQSPQHDRDDRRRDNRDQDRRDKDGRHEPERGAVSIPPHYRGEDVKYPRQTPDTRPQGAPHHREPPTGAAPIKRDDKRRQPEIRREPSREQYRSDDDRRRNAHGSSDSTTRQPGQYRAPDSRVQHPKQPPKAAPRHQEPPANAVRDKQEEKDHQRENHKEETHHRYRQGDERRGNVSKDDEADSQKRRPGRYDQYEQYR